MIERTLQWLKQATNGIWKSEDSYERSHSFRGVSTDSRTVVAGQLYIPLVGERFDGHNYVQEAKKKGAVAVLWQEDRPIPSIELPIIQVSDTLHALQQMAQKYRQELGIPIVAVTGSNGKTTTKDLLAAAFRSRYRVHQTSGNYNNHIGVPLTLLSIPEQTEIAVVEMGMNHAGEIERLSKIAKPDLAIITNIGESHIGFLGSREGIANAKLEIQAGLSHDGKLIMNGDEPLLTSKVANFPQQVIHIGWNEGNDDRPLAVEMVGFEGIQFRSSKTGQLFQIPLLGRHNAYNALLAIEAGRQFSCRDEEMAKSLKEAMITGGRLELKRAVNGMMVIDDTYNASPTSMRAAIDLQQELAPQCKKWILVSDMYEIGSEEEKYHRNLGVYAVEKGVERIYTLGAKGRWISQGAEQAGHAKIVHHFESKEEAIKHLSHEGNQNVLLLVKASQAAKLKQVVDQLT
ncbi:UDP-N-acetylmuramoyl-tripeptide--D-alanyl-D-alanine ligase [Seinonella peptonophila]|uniref:UDP-N-acetylmuramoyl-tripeptide--D-alanyl-D-alanine ligase n=1 Tax=Seinonella peptonophila TaxID=112248 RepID=A0A1M4UZW7_9BACL|nr:UDP-N-acetylmuramoyl-tripeptide--D-alanyl-D-alanine ligase [Seinonella peptonophila]SHE62209.1 UDP-N-acetylmuramoyl-tripeptide--D-alanyl-D-alanine ligase [Seinonella peptonophila]